MNKTEINAILLLTFNEDTDSHIGTKADFRDVHKHLLLTEGSMRKSKQQLQVYVLHSKNKITNHYELD